MISFRDLPVVFRVAAGLFAWLAVWAAIALTVEVFG